MAEQDGLRSGVIRGRVQGGMPGLPGGGLRPHPGGGDGDGPDLHGSQSQLPQRRRGGPGDFRGAGLQLMVDDDGADTDRVAVHVAAAGEVRRGGREGQGIRAAAAGDQYAFGVAGVGEGRLEQLPRLAEHGREAAGPAPAGGTYGAFAGGLGGVGVGVRGGGFVRGAHAA